MPRKATGRKSPGRKIATLDGLIAALKQKLGPAARVSATQSAREYYGPGHTSKFLYWSCGAEVTDGDGLDLKADVYCCDTPRQAIDKLMVELGKAQQQARAESRAARSLEHSRPVKRVEQRQGLRLTFQGDH